MSPVPDDTATRLSFQALYRWHAGLAGAFAHLDEPDCLRHLARAFGQLVPVESVMISLERKDRPPQLLYLQGIPEEFRDAIIERYFAGGYLLDPFCLAVENGLAEGFYPLEEIAPDDFFDSEYYKTYYLKLGCAEDSYYIVNLDEHSKISVSLFQGLGAASLSSAQLDLLRAVEPMVRTLVTQFAARGLQRTPLLFGPPADEQARDAEVNLRIQTAFSRFGCEVLTEREREAAQMVLRGHSVKSTAREMNISPETVRMHRKNLYLKLGISSQSELFARFIDWLRQS
ncbi:helix-turn-helix transcriptional regulator [Pseudomonas gingeri]|uniref:LuxR family transcriptional regulator n=1 Tax=Pseudomonas gingeri TaxID=117681 RepID=A0A7Y7YBL8_9PSED|nr:LuxR family transcriptional regulator [Pseudomonas gingeri]NWB25581.1 LuxR family transcriptional regulator [Pseudomonas gingeri]NWC33295.1 LuxR family transcriptional regulator [Pseudomonas gingeri]NWD08239.1 LuxR family transcriptional regulator [Pseudomonas gingeri]NWD48458.1 LuxR family transcriptional regulator [Pseudomonas gingeri]NWE33249.1 LuxR family transcriptional regulator [Pseudomonas gingeri]